MARPCPVSVTYWISRQASSREFSKEWKRKGRLYVAASRRGSVKHGKFDTVTILLRGGDIFPPGDGRGGVSPASHPSGAVVESISFIKYEISSG